MVIAAIMAALQSAVTIMTTTLTMVVAIGSSAMACGSGSMVPTTPITIADGCACGLSTLEAHIGGNAITTASATSRSGFQKAPLLRGFSPRPSTLGASSLTYNPTM